MTSTGALNSLSPNTGLTASKAALRFTPERDNTASGNDFLSRFNDLKKSDQPPVKTDKADKGKQGDAEKARDKPNPDAGTADPLTRIDVAPGNAAAEVNGNTLPANGQDLPPESVSENPTAATQADSANAAPAAHPVAEEINTAPAQAGPIAQAAYLARPDIRASELNPAQWSAQLRETAQITNRNAALLADARLADIGGERMVEERQLSTPASAQSASRRSTSIGETPFPTLSTTGTPNGSNLNPALAALGSETPITGLTSAAPAATVALPGNAAAMPGAQANLNMADPSWTRHLEAQVQQMIQQGPRTMMLQLNPAELGRLQIRVRMDDDVAKLTVTSQHGAVKEMIESSLPQLRQNLLADGLNLGEVEVTVSDDTGSNAGFADQREAAGEHFNERVDSGRASQADSDDAAEIALRGAVARAGEAINPGVDYFV